MAHITSFFGDKDNKVETEYTGNPELKALIKRMEKLEFTNHAMWIMLEKKGFTNEEFDQAMAEAYEIGKRKAFTAPHADRMRSSPITSKSSVSTVEKKLSCILMRYITCFPTRIR